MSLTADDVDRHAPNFNPMDLFNSATVRRCEIPSANGHASARALATCACALVEGGAVPEQTTKLNGWAPKQTRLLSTTGVKEAHGNPVFFKIFTVMKSYFGNAGWNDFKGERLRCCDVAMLRCSVTQDGMISRMSTYLIPS